MPYGVGNINKDSHLNEEYLTGADLPEGVYQGEQDEIGADLEGLLEGRNSTKLREGVISNI